MKVFIVCEYTWDHFEIIKVFRRRKNAERFLKTLRHKYYTYAVEEFELAD